MGNLQYSKPKLYLILISSTGSMPWDMWRTPSTQTLSAGWKGAGRRRPPRKSQPAALQSPSRRFLPPKKVQFPALIIFCIWDINLIYDSFTLSTQGIHFSLSWALYSFSRFRAEKTFTSNLQITGHSNNFHIKKFCSIRKFFACTLELVIQYGYYSHSDILFYMTSWALSRLSRFRVNDIKSPLCV